MRTKYTDSEFIDAVKSSVSIAEVLKKINLKIVGGNYRTVHIKIRKLGLDTSHFLGQRHLTGKKIYSKRIPLSEVLVQNSDYNRGTLKKRLIQDKIIEEKCSICGMFPEWNSKRLVLILDHINGVNNDNRIENLRLLCPNCNSQTDTFCCKTKSPLDIYNKVVPIKKCCDCGVEINKSAKGRCCNCYAISRRKVQRPTKETLEKEIKEKTWKEIGESYSVSANTIKKWARVYGISFLPKISRVKKKCILCGKQLSNRKNTHCRKCSYDVSRKVVRPSYDELLEKRTQMTYQEIGEEYGVAGCTIRSWIRQYSRKTI